jgi:SH3-like domain-containing protein
MGDELFQMREGDTVRVEAEHEDFVFVRTADGREGWVGRAGVAFVVPR